MKVFNLFRLAEKETLEMLRKILEITYEKNAKANANLVELKLAKLSR